MSGIVISILLILILLVCSALISGSEVAYYSLSPAQKDQLKHEQASGAILAKKLLDRPQELLATILIANNFINVGIVILSSSLLSQLYPPTPENETIRFILEIFLITFVILLIGEVIPKVYATKNSIPFAKFMARPLYVFSKLPPFSWLKIFLTHGTNIINKYAKKRAIKISSDELEQALALTKEDNTTIEEQRILEGIIKFGNTDVKQIMRSRMEVEAFEESSTFKEILEFILDAGYSRIPIYRKTFDEVVGILYIKDLLPYFDEADDFQWNKLIRKPFYVPENKKIDDLLKDFQTKKMHMAVVIDEYGGANGIATLEDVLEEIIGDITDEFDEDDIIFQQQNENEYVFEGRTSLIDFYKILDIDGKEFDLIKGDSDSLGGLMIENAGRILRNKEFLKVGQFKLVVESSDKKRIKSIKVIREDHEKPKQD
ncbi:MAG: gliding motility-associated protein GldE [Crocinitomicaceae bacterium]|jgi:gliding motility-associated protein GldE|nr:gliding motility-associated protein GldE [Crocinitomicaceae bacterium]